MSLAYKTIVFNLTTFRKPGPDVFGNFMTVTGTVLSKTKCVSGNNVLVILHGVNYKVGFLIWHTQFTKGISH